MQADVDPLIILNVYCFLWFISALGGLDVGPNHVVSLAGGNTLGELASVIGQEFPLCLLLIRKADLYRNPINWAIVLVPDGAENKGIGLAIVLRKRIGGRGITGENRHDQQGRHCRGGHSCTSEFSNHCPFRLRPRPHPRLHLR